MTTADKSRSFATVALAISWLAPAVFKRSGFLVGWMVACGHGERDEKKEKDQDLPYPLVFLGSLECRVLLCDCGSKFGLTINRGGWTREEERRKKRHDMWANVLFDRIAMCIGSSQNRPKQCLGGLFV